MKIIGLTGGIASGKSTAAEILNEQGAVVIDTDQLAHRIMEPGEPAWQDIVAHFGQDILNNDGSIDRGALGAIVFADAQQLQQLNRITHPRAGERLQQELEALRRSGRQLVFIEAALMYETGMDRLCSEIWVVWVDQINQRQRLMERNGFSPEEAQQRIAAQMSLDEKARRADLVIDNNADLLQLRKQVEVAYRELLSRIE